MQHLEAKLAYLKTRAGHIESISLHDESIGALPQGLHWKTVKDYVFSSPNSALFGRRGPSAVEWGALGHQ